MRSFRPGDTGFRPEEHGYTVRFEQRYRIGRDRGSLSVVYLVQPAFVYLDRKVSGGYDKTGGNKVNVIIGIRQRIQRYRIFPYRFALRPGKLAVKRVAFQQSRGGAESFDRILSLGISETVLLIGGESLDFQRTRRNRQPAVDDTDVVVMGAFSRSVGSRGHHIAADGSTVVRNIYAAFVQISVTFVYSGINERHSAKNLFGRKRRIHRRESRRSIRACGVAEIAESRDNVLRSVNFGAAAHLHVNGAFLNRKPFRVGAVGGVFEHDQIVRIHRAQGARCDQVLSDFVIAVILFPEERAQYRIVIDESAFRNAVDCGSVNRDRGFYRAVGRADGVGVYFYLSSGDGIRLSLISYGIVFGSALGYERKRVRSRGGFFVHFYARSAAEVSEVEDIDTPCAVIVGNVSESRIRLGIFVKVVETLAFGKARSHDRNVGRRLTVYFSAYRCTRILERRDQESYRDRALVYDQTLRSIGKFVMNRVSRIIDYDGVNARIHGKRIVNLTRSVRIIDPVCAIRTVALGKALADVVVIEVSHHRQLYPDGSVFVFIYALVYVRRIERYARGAPVAHINEVARFRRLSVEGIIYDYFLGARDVSVYFFIVKRRGGFQSDIELTRDLARIATDNRGVRQRNDVAESVGVIYPDGIGFGDFEFFAFDVILFGRHAVYLYFHQLLGDNGDRNGGFQPYAFVNVVNGYVAFANKRIVCVVAVRI